MSLSELVSFAVSGSAASAVSALLTDRVSPEERRGRPRQRGRGDELAADSGFNAASASTPQSLATRSAANGLIFFFTYYVAATAQYTGNGNAASSTEKNTRRAAKDAFRVGATASVFTRLFGFVAGPQRPAGYRWSLPALEDDAVLAIDPGLTFCFHEVLARSVASYLARPRRQQQRQRDHGTVHTEIVATLTTFALAAASKLVATGLTYPFHAAAAEATEQRWRATLTRDAEDDADAPLIFLSDEEEEQHYSRHAGRPRDRRGSRPPSKRQHNVLVVLLQMLRSGGVRSVYADWLRSVLTAALGHGLTMALQRSIYGYILQFVLSLVSRRRASPRATAAREVHSHSHSQIQAQPQSHPISEARSKVKNAVESWLDTSSVVSKGTVDVDDSVSNVTSRVSTRAPSRAPRRQLPPPTSAYQRRPREVAGLAPSRASEPTAFYPDAIAAGRRLQQQQQQLLQQPALPRPSIKTSRDFDDDGSLIFNMVSKSPRVINERREGS